MPKVHALPHTRRWTVADVIDFEHLIHTEDPARAADGEWLSRRARRPDESRADAFLAWLDAIRSRSVPLPGAAFERGRRLVEVFAIVIGLVIGGGLAGTLLARHEAEPINALMFFGGTVGIQLAFLALVAIGWIARATGLRIGIIQDTMLSLVDVAGRLSRRLDGDRRSAIHARRAALDLRAGRLAPLIGCRLLIVTQWFAIAFNVGLLVAMLLVYLPFVELRFGWQSTYAFTTAGVDAWVRSASAPWSWIAAGLAPDPGQVAATRYTRGQNAGSLPAEAAHAWWPFLLCAIAFYGLTLRVALAAVATVVLRRRLARLSFTHPDANALWRAMEGPAVAATGGALVLPSVSGGSGARPRGGVDVLIVDEDLATEAIGERVATLFGDVARTVRSNVDDDALSGALVTALGAGSGTVVIATAATRDPIVAVAAFVRAVAARLPADAGITFLLLGDATDDRMTIWRRFAGIQRLVVGIERCP